jgi:hypothetical protein
MFRNNKNYKYLIGILIGMFISIPMGYAAASYVGKGSELSYDNSNSSLTSSTAQDALDELYEIKNNPCPDGYVCTKN